MNALGQKFSCARLEKTREDMGRRGSGDAAKEANTYARERRAEGTSLLSWLDVEDHAQPGAAIWIVAVAAMFCIGLAYAYFSHMTG